MQYRAIHISRLLHANFRFAALALVVTTLCIVQKRSCSAAEPVATSDEASSTSSVTRLDHSYWEVSSRCLPDCAPTTGEMPAFNVTRCIDGTWMRSSVEELIDHCGERCDYHRLVVYVHGNWMNASDGRIRGRKNFGSVISCAKASTTFVAYSWPSERKHGYARDVLEKKDRTDSESYYLATLLTTLDCERGTGMMGFSFGSRIIMGALHMLHGGAIAGRKATQTVIRCVRISLFAPAFDRASLTHSGRYNQALVGVERIVNLYNSRDPVLKRFRFFDRDRPIAAGFAGLPVPLMMQARADRPLIASPKIIQYDCQNIGRTHSELEYYKCSAIKIALANVLGE